MTRLGVNVDHIATIREARKTYEPDPVTAASLSMLAGADGITIHLREDRRHIQDRDLRIMRETVSEGLNLELSCELEIVQIACETMPDQVTLEPERREEVTTEGGLDVIGERDRIEAALEKVHAKNIPASLFIDPDVAQVEASAELGVAAIELHTGSYALAKNEQVSSELARLAESGKRCAELGMKLHAGHGLNYLNVGDVAQIAGMDELNIGHSIVSRAVFSGLQEAVSEMKRLIELATH